ncbi:MAG: hypothetical protein KDD47_25830 [Acidobacteria bacterium]|nr:hypothetical protein [Acidobacteriota bacterium]
MQATTDTVRPSPGQAVVAGVELLPGGTGVLPARIAGAVEDLLAWFPEVPWVATLGGRRRLKARRVVAGDPKDERSRDRHQPRLLAGIIRWLLYLEFLASGWGMRRWAVYVAGLFVVFAGIYLDQLARRRGLSPLWFPGILAGIELVLVIPVCAYGWPPGAPLSWPSNLLAAFGVLGLVWSLDLLGAWKEPWGTQPEVRAVTLPIPGSEEPETPGGLDYRVVPEQRHGRFPSPSGDRLRQFRKELDLVLDARRRVDTGEVIAPALLLTLSDVFGRSFPRGVEFLALFERAQRGSLSQDDLRRRVDYLLAAPEEYLARPMAKPPPLWSAEALERRDWEF